MRRDDLDWDEYLLQLAERRANDEGDGYEADREQDRYERGLGL